jgi:hypothetical protein
MVIEYIAGNKNEVDALLSCLLAKLLQGSEAGLANSIARVLLKSCNSHPQMQIRGVQKSNHWQSSFHLDSLIQANRCLARLPDGSLPAVQFYKRYENIQR